MAEWLFSSGGHSLPADFDVRERLSFQHGAKSAYLEEVPVLPGIWLYRGEASARCSFSIEVDGGASQKGRIILGSILSSRGIASLEGCGDESWRDDGRAYVMTPVQRRVRYDIDAERGWSTVALRLESEALDVVGGDSGLPDVIVQALDKGRDDILGMGPLPSQLRAVGQALLRPPYEAGMGRLYRQAKTLELLAHHFAFFDRGAEGSDDFTPRDLAKLRMARDRLLFDLRDPPDLEGLAREVGLSAKRLNRGFRAVYGSTVFAYLRDARLDAARQALEEGTPLSLKQLAWELGYGQVSNFITAFRRRFGVSPGSYRGQLVS